MSSVRERLLYQDGQLTILVRAALGAPVVTLIGEVDATNSRALAAALASCHQGAHVDVDTGGLTFIDISGLRVLVMPTLPPSQRWIRLHNVTPSQQRLLRMMGWFYQPHADNLPA
ncbi:STAS domain-containing protein [Nonomuraea jiangxiensis]|uniref:Anti-anti-sigma factor n=1 Tax=Nonomuraea jiangxiensis TaxID=633440 RepID=A0A1G9T0Y6_9ACTN|nr:STAS domain-containing protein [Nonomuraea jiangxiensis]SDM41369.1 anti-anti-sigma factor [Nonomuraea jiangxiensis]